MIKTYRLKKEYPGHTIGDMIYKDVEGIYKWDIEPQTSLSNELVENNPDFFEEVIGDWKAGDVIYFLSVSGEIIDEIFDPKRHSSLIYWGNAFKEESESKWYQTQIAKIMYGSDNIVINKSEFLQILLSLQDNDIEKAKGLIKKYL